MYQVTTLTNSPLQNMTLILPNGNQMTLTIYFRPNQLGWFINQLTYKTFTLTGIRISNNPNILYQWKNIIPFGLACYSSGNVEPMQQNDFATGNSILYVLDTSEVEQLVTLYENGEA